MIEMSTLEFNQQKTNEFIEKIVSLLNDSMLGIMISIGHRTNLFDELFDLPPLTLHEIAKKTNLNQRYLQEWLHCMVVGKIIEYYPETKQFKLPKEHAMVISRQAGHKNLASYTQWISSLGSVESKIVECFKNGGGVEYEYYTDYLNLLSTNSNLKYNALLTKIISSKMPELNDNLSRGINVLDVGCGYGHAVQVLAKNYPNSFVTGIDISEMSIKVANEESQKSNVNNAIFQVADVEKLADDKKYNLITAFDIIHDVPNPLKVLESIYNSLERGGIFLMVDIKASSNVENNLDHPMGSLLYAVSTLHCLTVSLAEGGVGLGTVWGKEKAVDLLKEAGFDNIEIIEVEYDSMNSYFVAKK